MARVTGNLLTKGIQGSIGKTLVFKIRNGKTYVAKHPPKRTGEIPTEKQLVAREKFIKAQQYAQKVNHDTTLKATYSPHILPGQTVLNVAYKDAFYSPVISDLKRQNLMVRKGDELIVKAIDNFRVCSVVFSIIDKQGSIIEKGEAIPSGNGIEWTYTLQSEISHLDELTLRVVAKDLPGNESALEQRL